MDKEIKNEMLRHRTKREQNDRIFPQRIKAEEYNRILRRRREREEYNRILRQRREREEDNRILRRRIEREEDNRILRQKNEELKMELNSYKLIKTPMELSSSSEKSRKNLVSLIQEVNICFSHKAYTALGLLSRKLLHNIGVMLLKEDAKNKKFEEIVTLLYENNFLTTILKENVDKLIRISSNNLNHTTNIHTTEKEANRYMESIKYLLIANFRSEEIMTQQNDVVNNQNEFEVESFQERSLND